MSAVTVRPMKSQRARFLLRRNYRWLRRAGVTPLLARLVLDSTMRAVELEQFYEQQQRWEKRDG